MCKRDTLQRRLLGCHKLQVCYIDILFFAKLGSQPGIENGYQHLLPPSPSQPALHLLLGLIQPIALCLTRKRNVPQATDNERLIGFTFKSGFFVSFIIYLTFYLNHDYIFFFSYFYTLFVFSFFFRFRLLFPFLFTYFSSILNKNYTQK